MKNKLKIRYYQSNLYKVMEWRRDEWFCIIFTAYLLLTLLNPGAKIAQIKEKFGGLRFYIDGHYFGLFISSRNRFNNWLSSWAESKANQKSKGNNESITK